MIFGHNTHRLGVTDPPTGPLDPLLRVNRTPPLRVRDPPLRLGDPPPRVGDPLLGKFAPRATCLPPIWVKKGFQSLKTGLIWRRTGGQGSVEPLLLYTGPIISG